MGVDLPLFCKNNDRLNNLLHNKFENLLLQFSAITKSGYSLTQCLTLPQSQSWFRGSPQPCQEKLARK